MGLGAAHHPCLLHCPPGTWVGDVLLENPAQGIGARGGLGTLLGDTNHLSFHINFPMQTLSNKIQRSVFRKGQLVGSWLLESGDL